MKRIYTTTLRLNLADEDDRRVYEHLRQMEKKQYRSYSKAVVADVNDHFERQARLAADPYLETREREDAFLRQIMETIEKGLSYPPAVISQFSPPTVQTQENMMDNEELSAALDFADSF